MEDKVSVIIPVYNSEKYLKRCIKSVIFQTYKNIEIIIVDDGSTDKSKDIYSNMTKTDNRIKVIKKENGGSSSARNSGIDYATGKYIIFIDSDDWMEKNCIDDLNSILKKNKAELLIYGITTNENSNYDKNVENYMIKDNNFMKELANLILKEKINSPCNKLYNANIIKENNIKFDENITIGEDLLFNINYIKNINSIYYTSKEYYHYSKEQENSLSTKYNTNKYDELMAVNEKIQNILLDISNKRLIKTIDFIRIKNIYSCIIDLHHENCKLSKKEKIKFIKKMKRENKIGIINFIGVKPFVFSIIYKFIPSRILLMASKKVKRNY